MDAYDTKNIARYVKLETAKGDFKEALEQIALAIKGDDPAPILDDDQPVIIIQIINLSFIRI